MEGSAEVGGGVEMPPLANQPLQEVSAKGTEMTDRETEVHSKEFTPEQAAI